MRKGLVIIVILLFSFILCACEENVTPQVNQGAIDQVIASIDGLPLEEEIEIEDEWMIDDIEAKYGKLTEEEKKLVTNYSVYITIKEKIASLKQAIIDEDSAQPVIKLIVNLPKENKVTLKSKEKIEEARRAYDELTDGAKEFVSNYDYLLKVEKVYNQLVLEEEWQTKADLVTELISNLPNMSNLTITDEEKVINARKEYNALPDEAKEKVLNYQTLCTLENLIDLLKKELDFDVTTIMNCISDVANTDTVDELILENEYVTVEWSSSNNDLYYFEDGYGKVNILNQTYKKQIIYVTANIKTNDGTNVTLSKEVTVNPIKFEELPKNPVATYFAVGALSAYKNNSDRYMKEKTIFSEKAKEVLDIVYYAFAYVDNGGNLLLGDESVLPEMMELKKHNVRIVLVINGVSAQYSQIFKNLTSLANTRLKFINNIMDTVEKYKFDGVDIDWESAAGCYVEADKMNSLIKELRHEMNRRQDSGGSGYYLSCAIPGTSWGTATDRFDLKTISEYVDYINMMAYDLNNPDKTTHLSSMYTSSNDNGYGFGCDYAVKLYQNRGVPAEKIIIGSAGYGKAYKVSGTFTGKYPALGVDGKLTIVPNVSGSFDSGTLYGSAVTALMNSGKYEKYTEYNSSGKIVGSYLYSKTDSIFVTYESEEVIIAKYEYATNYEGMGIMSWCYTEDTSDNYINSIYDMKVNKK